MQRDTLHAKLKDIYMNNRERLDVAMAADQICTAITNDEKVKGLYLYGPFGTGKSFILGAIANQLKSQKDFINNCIFTRIYSHFKRWL